jgi:outer membrane autotransporter protein
MDKFVIIDDMRDLEKKVVIQISDDDKFKNALELPNAKEEILGPVFTYFASYNDGSLEFEYAFDFNPSVFIAPITMQTGGYLGQLNSYEQAFSIIDPALSEEGAKGLWLSPYAYNEDIDLNKDLTVSNTAYGAFMGYNSTKSDLGRNINGVFSIYGAYNSSNQSYKDATIDQGGGMLGATAVFFKERFYTAFTANVGVISEHGQGKYGKDNFMMYSKGIAARAGYNISLDENEKYTLQPSLDLSCSVIDIAPYKNTAGVKVDTGRFSPFNIEPGLKLATDLEKGLKSFVNVNMVWTLAGDTDCTANDIELPVMSIDPYIEYGVGLNKSFTESLSAGAELYGRSLGRRGVGGQLNIRWAFGS